MISSEPTPVLTMILAIAITLRIAQIADAPTVNSLITDLEKIKYSTNPYNVNALTQAADVAALQENSYYMKNCRRIIKSRNYTKKQLERLGFVVLPSKANFLFAKTDKIDGKELYLKLKEKGVLVRYFAKERIRNFNRITIGSQKDMEAFIAAVEEILGA